MNKNQVADILDEIGTLLELKGENPFKSRAYHNASRTISSLTKDLKEVISSKEIFELQGIGKAIAEKVTEMVETGRSEYYEELKAEFPPGVIELLQIQGLGPKKIKLLYDKLKIKSIEELKEAATTHKLAGIEGFGAKTEENILKGIEQLQRQVDKHPYFKAKEAADRICDTIAKLPGVIRCEFAGSIRRRKEIIGDIDILVAAKRAKAEAIMQTFVSHPDVIKILGHGETKSSVILYPGINCDLRVIDEVEYPFALAYFTGSKEHNVAMRSRAKKYGLSLNEYGFSTLGTEETRGKAKRIIKCKSEEDIFKALELQYIPPELRENLGELEASEQKKIPTLVEEEDLRGTFHCHTTYSDGKATLEEMVAGAKALGWEYLGIADHSKVAAYAGGLTEERVKQQHQEIDALNAKMKNFRIFKGTEVDILTDGTLDWSDKVLARFDYVVASIHSKFKMTETEATKRVIRALKNKYVTMLGHLTGRLLLQREGYPLNIREVIDCASDYGKIIEINSNPLRLELDWRWWRYAKEKGVKTSINPDAHSVNGLQDVRYGVGIARKGWLTKDDVLNTRSLKDVQRVLYK